MRYDSSAKVKPQGFAAIWNLEKKNDKTSGTQDKCQGPYGRSDNGDADENVQNKGKQNFNQLTPNLE